MTRFPRTFTAVSLALALLLALTGCARTSTRDGEHAEHEEEHTGPHGGDLVELTPESVAAAGIETGAAGPRAIEVVLALPGEIQLNGEHRVDVRPTYPGRVKDVRAGLGDDVQAGRTLAVIHSSESFSDYEVAAPMTGTVVARPVNPGAAVDRETVLFTIADLGTVWLDIPVYLQDLDRVRRGQRVRVRSEGGPAIEVSGTIDYIGPVLDAATRTSHARVVLPNRDRRLQPGRLVTAIVAVEAVTVPIAVPEDAIVRIGPGAAVFRADSTGFEVQPVTTGRTDGRTTEIVSGLEPGARVVVKNATALKAELEKEAGGHDH